MNALDITGPPPLWFGLRRACCGRAGNDGPARSEKVTCGIVAGEDATDAIGGTGVAGRVVYPGAASGVNAVVEVAGVGVVERGVSGGGRLSSSMMRSSGRDAVGHGAGCQWVYFGGV